MKKVLKFATIIAATQLAVSCAVFDQLDFMKSKEAPAPLDYLENSVKFNVKNFLNGDLTGFAIVQDQNGKIENTYTIKGNGKWEETHGTIQYSMAYNGGKKEGRTWLITTGENGEYTAIGHDFVETAQGQQLGNASKVSYALMTNYKDKKQKIDFDDRFYLVDENSAIIISTMKQGRILIGKTIISLQKVKN